MHPAQCQHEAFRSEVKVERVVNETERTTTFKAILVYVVCTQCDTRFKFEHDIFMQHDQLSVAVGMTPIMPKEEVRVNTTPPLNLN